MSADADVDRGKAALYGGHKVLIAAAADGDAVYLAGGVAEEYVRYGSEVWFYTMETGSLRPYGGEVVPAEAVDAVNRVWPDVILCPRGSAAKPLFDALEAVLEREPDYRPSVLQGLSGDEHPDFYADNPASTQMPLSGTTAANWERRLRLPVSSSLLTRSLLRASGGFASLLGGAAARAEALYSMNGDRVFWPRAGSTPESLDFIKLMSGDGDFVYHYYVDVLGKESFELYASGLATDQVYTVSWEGDRCSAKLNAGHVDVICPKGRTCIVTVTSADGSYWDTVVFSNPGRFARETAPHPVTAHGIYERADEDRVDEIALELDPLRHRAGDDRRRRRAEHGLEEEERPVPDPFAGREARHSESAPAEPARGLRHAEHERRAYDVERERSGREVHQVLHHDVRRVLRAGEPRLDEREARLHREHQYARYERPYYVQVCLHLRCSNRCRFHGFPLNSLTL